MVRVQLQKIDPSGDESRIVTMAGVPHEGDYISLNDDVVVMQVRSVIWLIDDPKADVQVRYR